MSTATLNRDEIIDVQGRPLRSDAAELLKILDRLLTVGTYYSLEHEQYLHAVETACAHLARAIAPRSSMSVEIAANGLLVEGQVVDAHHRVARKIHDLLVHLNIARLELSRHLTPADLRATLKALQDERLKLGQSGTFRQIVIEDLPATVNIATRRIGVASEYVSLDDLLDLGEEPMPAAQAPDTDSERRHLTSEFLTLVERLLAGLDTTLPAADGQGAGVNGPRVTAEQIATLREAVQGLLDRKPALSELRSLVDRVRAALATGQDPHALALAFRVLNREVGAEKTDAGAPVDGILGEDLSITSEMLVHRCAELNACSTAVAPPLASARRDLVAIALGMFVAGPRESVRARCLALLETAFAAPDAGPDEVAAIAALFDSTGAREPGFCDSLLPPVLAAIRRGGPQHLAALWERLWSTDAATRTGFWPHLVNDLLLGLEAAPAAAVLQLWVDADAAATAPALVTRLGRLEALREDGQAPGLDALLQTPLSRTGGVLSCLMQTRLAGSLGPRLHVALQRGGGNDLARVLTAALYEYTPAHRRFYVELARELGTATPSPRFARQAADVLVETLAELPPDERCETWTAEAVAWLPVLVGGEARPMLARVLRERRLLVFRAWPSACRAAAAEALAGLRNAGSGAD